jgi:hypothetical protein
MKGMPGGCTDRLLTPTPQAHLPGLKQDDIPAVGNRPHPLSQEVHIIQIGEAGRSCRIVG